MMFDLILGIGLVLVIFSFSALVIVDLFRKQTESNSTDKGDKAANREFYKEIVKSDKQSGQLAVKQNIPSLVPTNTAQVREKLSAKGLILRFFGKRESISTAQDATDITNTETDMMEAQGNQIITVMKMQNQIADQQTEQNLKPLKEEEQSTGLQKNIAKNKLEIARSKDEANKISNPPPTVVAQPAKQKNRPLGKDEQVKLEMKAYDEGNKEIDNNLDLPEEQRIRLKEERKESMERKINEIYR